MSLHNEGCGPGTTCDLLRIRSESLGRMNPGLRDGSISEPETRNASWSSWQSSDGCNESGHTDWDATFPLTPIVRTEAIPYPSDQIEMLVDTTSLRPVGTGSDLHVDFLCHRGGYACSCGSLITGFDFDKQDDMAGFV
jgi:hypothetical protein